ncbi:MAG: hypothetical protein NTY90_04145, partial [Candidatus Micrarchaeota archaeon]|nr:hypothetical protein [Candidatus Micrarchaeota archaeon]
MNTKIFGIVLLVFGALGALASGFSIQANPDYIVLHGTEAKVFVSATNDGPAGSISFSVDSGELTASVVSPVQSAAAGETKGTYVTVNAPDCFRGSGDIEITAQLASGGNAAYDSKIVHVMVYPTEQCDQYTDSAPAGGQYVPAGSVPAVLFTSYADPAEYRVGVLGGERPVALGPGQFKRVTLKIINYGAAADFELRVFGDSLNAFLDKESVSLQRSEAADVHLDVRPAADAELARHFATVQVLAQNQVVYEKDVAFDVSVRHDIRLVLPTSIIKSDGTKPVAVQAALQNAGTGAEVLKITTSASASAPATVSVAPGETKKFIVLVDVTKLVPGENPVEIRAENDFVEGSGKVIVS